MTQFEQKKFTVGSGIRTDKSPINHCLPKFANSCKNYGIKCDLCMQISLKKFTHYYVE